jgi:hypothetical protein
MLSHRPGMTVALNLPGRRRDQGQASITWRGHVFMKSIRPDNTDPIPLRTSPHRMGTIMLRFVGLLAIAIAALAFAWSR